MFIPGQTYKRSAIHDEFGGSRQSGISPSRKVPAVFIFSGESGGSYGYKDRWENKNVFSYTGEGQVGDMKFVRGNLALRDHLTQQKRVFLFKYSKKRGYVDFVGEMEVIDFGFFETHDRDGQTRIGIKFFFKKRGVQLYEVPNELRTLEKELSGSYDFLKPNKTERQGLIISRVGQGAYRKSILHRWEYECAVSQYNDPKTLIASHIVPWKDANNEERLDVDNGILLSPVYDALFDKGMISFENSGKIILSDYLNQFDIKKINVSGMERIHGFSEENLKYLDRHRMGLLA